MPRRSPRATTLSVNCTRAPAPVALSMTWALPRVLPVAMFSTTVFRRATTSGASPSRANALSVSANWSLS
jgi:hypothetical protein